MRNLRRLLLASLSVLLLGATLSGCCGENGCIKDPPCKKKDCGCAK